MGKVTVLVLEGEAVVAVDLSGKLRQLGYEVSGIAAEGEEAVTLARHSRPDLVLMDVSLKQKEEIVIQSRKSDPAAGEESEPEIVTERPARKMTRLRRSKAAEQSKPIANQKPKVDHAARQEVHSTAR